MPIGETNSTRKRARAVSVLPRATPHFSSRLAPRELQCARLAAKGWDNYRIAGKMGVASGYVKQVMNRVYMKLGITQDNGVQRVLLANLINRKGAK
jgi:DNA-binding NarL/FixJ family response regulator